MKSQVNETAKNMLFAASMPLVALVAFALQVSCAHGVSGNSTETTSSSPLVTENPVGLKIPYSHSAVIEQYSAGDSEFAGLYNTFELKATLLNTDVREALIRRQAEYYQWDEAQQSTEREKATQELSAETEVFLSFATPERKNDNLTDKKSIWRIFLDVGGRRYVGQPKKERRLIAELQAQFPFHTRWNTPYMLSFPVSAKAIETQTVKLTLTGPLGSRVLEFKPVPLGSNSIGTSLQSTEPPMNSEVSPETTAEPESL